MLESLNVAIDNDLDNQDNICASQMLLALMAEGAKSIEKQNANLIISVKALERQKKLVKITGFGNTFTQEVGPFFPIASSRVFARKVANILVKSKP